MRENDNPYLSKIILVGNKKDLSEGREVSTEEGKKKAEDLHLDDFLEISVKSSDDVDLLFRKITRLLYNNIFNDSHIKPKIKTKLKTQRKGEEKKKCC